MLSSKLQLLFKMLSLSATSEPFFPVSSPLLSVLTNVFILSLFIFLFSCSYRKKQGTLETLSSFVFGQKLDNYTEGEGTQLSQSHSSYLSFCLILFLSLYFLYFQLSCKQRFSTQNAICFSLSLRSLRLKVF